MDRQNDDHDSDQDQYLLPGVYPKPIPPVLTPAYIKSQVSDLISVVMTFGIVGDQVHAEQLVGDKKLSMHLKIAQMTSTTVDVVHAKTNSKHDEWQLFGNYVASKLRELYKSHPDKAKELERRLVDAALEGVRETVQANEVRPDNRNLFNPPMQRHQRPRFRGHLRLNLPFRNHRFGYYNANDN